MNREPPGEMRIGEVLRDARQRAGLELRDVEQRTKIRLKYLRALESEDWGELPTSAYAKGFLRTYAQLLGLDAEALVDEYRRQVEGTSGAPTYPLGDRQLERRRPPIEQSRFTRPAFLLAVGAVAVIAAIAVIAFTGGDERPGRAERGAGHAPGKGKGKGKRGNDKKGSSKPEEPTPLALSIKDAVEVCLLGGAGKPLIAQVLAPGTHEAYSRREFELRFPSGFDPDQFKLELAGHPRLLPKANGPVSYAIRAPKRVTELSRPPGEECP